MRTYITTVRYNDAMLGRTVEREWDYFPLAYLAIIKDDAFISEIKLRSTPRV